MRLCQYPFEGYKSSGPYFHEKNGRWHVNLLTLNGTSKPLNMTYAKYLVSIKERRIPSPGEEVDHVDGDRTNDLLGNLRIISKKENRDKAQKDPRGNPKKETFLYICNKCGDAFLCNRNTAAHLRGNHTAFCGRSCMKGPRVLLFEGLNYEIVKKPPIISKNLGEDWHSFSRKILQSDIQVAPDVKLARSNNLLKIVKSAKSVLTSCPQCTTTFYPKSSCQVTCSRVCSDIFFRRIKVISEQALLDAKDRIDHGVSNWVREAKLLGISDNGLRKKVGKLK